MHIDTHRFASVVKYSPQPASAHTSRLSRFARPIEDCANRKSPASTATLVPYRLLTVTFPAPHSWAVDEAHTQIRSCAILIRSGAQPLRVWQSSTTSSCTRLAVWIISVISASLRCLSVMSLQHTTGIIQPAQVRALSSKITVNSRQPGKLSCGAGHHENYSRPELLSTSPKYLVCRVHEQLVPVAHHVLQVDSHLLHIRSHRF